MTAILDGHKPDAVRLISVRETDDRNADGVTVHRTDCEHAAIASFTGIETANSVVLRFEGTAQIGFVELNIKTADPE